MRVLAILLLTLLASCQVPLRTNYPRYAPAYVGNPTDRLAQMELGSRILISQVLGRSEGPTMLDNHGRILCNGCGESMRYRTDIDLDGACFVFYCDCGHGDVYRIMTAHVRNIAQRKPPTNLDLAPG